MGRSGEEDEDAGGVRGWFTLRIWWYNWKEEFTHDHQSQPRNATAS
jgi:hypothetical protein